MPALREAAVIRAMGIGDVVYVMGQEGKQEPHRVVSINSATCVTCRKLYFFERFWIWQECLWGCLWSMLMMDPLDEYYCDHYAGPKFSRLISAYFLVLRFLCHSGIMVLPTEGGSYLGAEGIRWSGNDVWRIWGPRCSPGRIMKSAIEAISTLWREGIREMGCSGHDHPERMSMVPRPGGVIYLKNPPEKPEIHMVADPQLVPELRKQSGGH